MHGPAPILHTGDTDIVSSDAVITLFCRHGLMSVLRNDDVIGRCLQKYGEWAEAELDLLRRFVPEGGSIVDAGANVGTHSLAFAKHVGPTGHVLAFEPQPFVHRLLVRNIEQNATSNVQTYERALSASPGTMSLPVLDYAQPENFGGVKLTQANTVTDVNAVGVDNLDSYELSACDLLKIDVEGMESEVVAGAADTILRLRPVVYAECSSVSTGWPLLQALFQMNYVCSVHRAQVFNPDNYFGDPESIYGIACESNLLALPSERVGTFSSILRDNQWLVPVSTLDDLARAVFDTPRWGDLTLRGYSRWGLLSRIVRQQEDLHRLRGSAESREADLQRFIAGKDSAFLTAHKALEDAAAREADLHRIIAGREAALTELQQSIAGKESALLTAHKALEDAAARETDLHRIIAGREAALTELQQIIAGKESALLTAHKALEDAAAREADLHRTVAGREAALTELQQIIAGKESALLTAHKALEDAAAREADLHRTVAGRDAVITELQQNIAGKEGALLTAHKVIEDAAAREAALHRIVAGRDAAITELQQSVTGKEGALLIAHKAIEDAAAQEAALHRIAAEKDAALMVLQREMAEAQRVLASIPDAHHHRTAKLSQRALEVATLREQMATLREEAGTVDQAMATLRKEADAVGQAMAMLRDEAATLQLQVVDSLAERNRALSLMEEHRSQGEMLQAKVAAMSAAVENLERQLHDILQSGSWRVTAPLRSLWSVMRRTQ